VAAVIYTALALIAFAANSLLCRMALGGHRIDPVSFTAIRLMSGALTLVFILRYAGDSGNRGGAGGSWRCGFALFTYAAAFSLAYVTLDTGIGALILFASVQVTMLGSALVMGEDIGVFQWVGLAAAIGGLVYLVMPGMSAPGLAGSLLMCIAGIAWGVYSIIGKGATAPIAMTAGNFYRSIPMVILASAVAYPKVYLQPSGILLALISGSVTSGLGYVLWYRALRDLTMVRASILQLLVPVLAAVGGIGLLGEEVSARLIIASILILGGVSLAVVVRKARTA
jgi:drug/metabolite transporter (DMT)-like permease